MNWAIVKKKDEVARFDFFHSSTPWLKKTRIITFPSGPPNFSNTTAGKKVNSGVNCCVRKIGPFYFSEDLS
jgi:hypothetical protein